MPQPPADIPLRVEIYSPFNGATLGQSLLGQPDPFVGLVNVGTVAASNLTVSVEITQGTDVYSVAAILAEEGIEQSTDKIVEHVVDKELPSGWAAPVSAYKWHNAMRAHGDNVNRMEELKRERYHVMDRLGDPDVRYDLPGTSFYLGPGGRTYDRATGKPLQRFGP